MVMENPQTTKSSQPEPERPQRDYTKDPIAGQSPTTVTAAMMNSYDVKYQHKLDRWCQLQKFDIRLKNKETGKLENTPFERMAILQSELDEIDDMRTLANDTLRESQHEASLLNKAMYKKAAQYCLFNIKAGRPMTAEEYDLAPAQDIRPAIDSTIILALIGDPN